MATNKVQAIKDQLQLIKRTRLMIDSLYTQIDMAAGEQQTADLLIAVQRYEAAHRSLKELQNSLEVIQEFGGFK